MEHPRKSKTAVREMEKPLQWAETLVECLRANDITFASYVPDNVIWQVLKLLGKDPGFKLVAATREEEAVGIVAGAYLGQRRSALFVQNSGLINSLNAFTSLVMPYRIPFPIFISLRGDLGEFNIAQAAGGRVTRPILEALGLQHFMLTRAEDVDVVVNGAIKLCYSSRLPVALILSPILTGGKSG